jgi:AraC-like DNA-binding protein
MLRDEVLFDTGQTRVGLFLARPEAAAFDTAGDPTLPTFVFPRSAVWIEHHGRRPFVADPNVVTLYNPGARYRRHLLRENGDRCDWFQVSEELFARSVRRLFPAELDLAEPFRSLKVRADPQLYLTQRLLTRYVRETASPDPRRVEEGVVALLGRVLQLAAGERCRQPASRSARGTHKELAERARAQLDLRFREGPSLATLAGELNTSMHHLCRVFKRETGITIGQYQTRLRMAESLERIREGAHLTDAALDLGFSSHSHFTERFRKTYGVAPSRYREMSRIEGWVINGA